MPGTGDKLQGLLMLRQQRHVLRGTLLAQTGQGLFKPFLFNRFQQIIKRVLFKRLYRVLIKGRQKDDIGTVLRVEHADHLQPADARHLNIEEQHVRAQFMHRTDAFNGIGTFPHNLDITLLLQQDTQVFPC